MAVLSFVFSDGSKRDSTISYFLHWNFVLWCFFTSETSEKNPQFNFSSQDLSIEHNFFKWAVKVTKILHLLFCFGCKNFKINWHLMAISGPIVLTNSNLVSINYLIRERNQWLFTFSDTIRFYILFLTLLCFGGKNRPPDGFIIYLWHQNPQHSLFLLTFQVYKTLAFLVPDQNFWCKFLPFSENVRKKMTSHILAAEFWVCVTFYRLIHNYLVFGKNILKISFANTIRLLLTS